MNPARQPLDTAMLLERRPAANTPQKQNVTPAVTRRMKTDAGSRLYLGGSSNLADKETARDASVVQARLAAAKYKKKPINV